MAHRTQLILDESSYGFLKREAKRAGVSFSEMLRRFFARPHKGRAENEGCGISAALCQVCRQWDWIDCMSFECMEANRLRDALSLDHHFAQAGFRLLA